jgi:N-acetylglucosaminyldiphosphoundecaprenol N-acetyl-beta-D-mannosaminyltransferase
MNAIARFSVARVPVSIINMDVACKEVERRCAIREGGYCIFRDMNGIVAANDDPRLLLAHEAAALVAPDGMPLVWLAHLNGFGSVQRVYGPDFMLEFCRRTEHTDIRHYLFGSTDVVIETLARELRRAFPDISICGTFSPPFRHDTASPNFDEIERIRAARPDVVWVGLGTPKQELWMHANAPHLSGCVLLGVGAAFDFHAKLKPQAPRWMQRSGLEWSFRLITEPRRLARRYIFGIPRFIFLLAKYGCQLRN